MARTLSMLLLAIAVCCAAASSAFALTCPNTLRVAVLKDGKLTVDGKATTLEGLDASLSELGKINGNVWYYRENSHRAPSPAADETMMAVMKLLVKHKRPVSFSYNADYSDAIDDQGNSSPRTKC